jgi:hypothetical protein
MRPRLVSRLRCATAFAAAVAVLGGCGTSTGNGNGNGVASRAPAQIVAAAEAAATSAATVHVMGSIVHEGKPIWLNVELVADKGGKGRLAQDGHSLDVVQVDSDVYLKANEAFYDDVLGPPAARLLRGRWLKASNASGDFAPLAALTSLSSVVRITLADHGALIHAPTTTIAGRRVVGVTDGAAGGTLYVAATGVPYPVEVVQRRGRVVFDKWNKSVTLSVPEGAVNVKQVQRGRR